MVIGMETTTRTKMAAGTPGNDILRDIFMSNAVGPLSYVILEYRHGVSLCSGLVSIGGPALGRRLP